MSDTLIGNSPKKIGVRVGDEIEYIALGMRFTSKVAGILADGRYIDDKGCDIGQNFYSYRIISRDKSTDPAAIRKAALQEAADVVREFGNAMSRIGLHPDADSLRCDAASVALIGASSAILALIEKDASDE